MCCRSLRQAFCHTSRAALRDFFPNSHACGEEAVTRSDARPAERRLILCRALLHNGVIKRDSFRLSRTQLVSGGELVGNRNTKQRPPGKLLRNFLCEPAARLTTVTSPGWVRFSNKATQVSHEKPQKKIKNVHWYIFSVLSGSMDHLSVGVHASILPCTARLALVLPLKPCPPCFFSQSSFSIDLTTFVCFCDTDKEAH